MNFLGNEGPINLFYDITNDHKTLEDSTKDQEYLKI